MYNITVMDQYSPAVVTVPANMSSVEISQFPDNGTSIIANREYTITVSAKSDQGMSYPSDPVVVGEFTVVHKQMYWIRTNLQRFQPSNVKCNIRMLIFHYIMEVFW